MLSSQIKSNEIVFGSCNKDFLEEIIFYGIGLGADFVEIFIENTDNSSVLAEEDFITSVSPSFGRGAGIRIFKGKKDGFVSTNDLTKHGLMRSVSQAIEMLDITDNKREVFNGLNEHRDYSLSKKKWINEVPSIHDIFGITSLASPINVAPFTGLVNFPFLIRYPSSTAKLNCPVAPTLPPPIDLQ